MATSRHCCRVNCGATLPSRHHHSSVLATAAKLLPPLCYCHSSCNAAIASLTMGSPWRCQHSSRAAAVAAGLHCCSVWQHHGAAVASTVAQRCLCVITTAASSPPQQPRCRRRRVIATAAAKLPLSHLHCVRCGVANTVAVLPPLLLCCAAVLCGNMTALPSRQAAALPPQQPGCRPCRVIATAAAMLPLRHQHCICRGIANTVAALPPSLLCCAAVLCRNDAALPLRQAAASRHSSRVAVADALLP